MDAKQVKERWGKAIRAVRKEIDEYRLNQCFIEDEQWVKINRSSHTIDPVARVDPNRVRLTVNKFGPATRGMMGLLFARPLFFDITPTSADETTVAAARLGIRVLDDLRLRQDWEPIREDLGRCVWTGGTGALCLEWDPNAGPAIPPPPDGVLPGASNIGDIVTSALGMGEFAIEPGARVAETARWWVKAIAIPPEQARVDWNLSTTPKPDTTETLTPMQREGETRQELVTVYTYYERPSTRSPGTMTVVVGDEVIEGPWPFPFTDRLNINVARETIIHGRWAGKTILSSARSPQVAMNQAHSSIVEHMKNCGNARTWVDWTDFDRIDQLTDTPGEFVGYNGDGAKPLILSPPVMPNWWSSQPGELGQVIDEMLGSVEVARGVAPRNVESGLGLSILSENAQSPLGHLAKEFARVFGRHATLALRTLEAKATEPRSGAYVNDPEDLPEEFTWIGSDLKGQTTATVPLEAVAPKSRAQAEQWATTLLQAGRITYSQFARLVDVPDARDTVNIIDPDTSKQQRENRRMARGEKAEIADFDNHKLHMAEVNNFCKSEAYEMLTPERQQLFGQHRVDHEQAALKEAIKDAEAASSPEVRTAANAQETPGSLPVDPGGTDAASGDQGSPTVPPGPEPNGAQPVGVGSPGSGQGLEVGGGLPQGGLAP